MNKLTIIRYFIGYFLSGLIGGLVIGVIVFGIFLGFGALPFQVMAFINTIKSFVNIDTNIIILLFLILLIIGYKSLMRKINQKDFLNNSILVKVLIFFLKILLPKKLEFSKRVEKVNSTLLISGGIIGFILGAIIIGQIIAASIPII